MVDPSVQLFVICAGRQRKLEDLNRFHHFCMSCQHQDQLEVRVKGCLHEIAMLEVVGGAVHLLIHVDKYRKTVGRNRVTVERRETWSEDTSILKLLHIVIKWLVRLTTVSTSKGM